MHVRAAGAGNRELRAGSLVKARERLSGQVKTGQYVQLVILAGFGCSPRSTSAEIDDPLLPKSAIHFRRNQRSTWADIRTLARTLPSRGALSGNDHRVQAAAPRRGCRDGHRGNRCSRRRRRGPRRRSTSPADNDPRRARHLTPRPRQAYDPRATPRRTQPGDHFRSPAHSGGADMLTRIGTAAALAAALAAAPAHGQGPRQWTITSDMEGRLVAVRLAAEAEAARSPWWIGEPAPLFISISREIYDVGGETGDESWLMFSLLGGWPGGPAPRVLGGPAGSAAVRCLRAARLRVGERRHRRRGRAVRLREPGDVAGR